MNWISELAKEKYNPIPKDEEIQLIREYKESGNKEAAKKIINANLRYVSKLCAKFTLINSDMYNEIFQSAIIGMYKALDNYDPKFNVKFLTFAYKYIFHEIYKVLTDNLTILSVPNNMKVIIVTLYRTVPDLYTQLEREPTIEEIVSELKKRLKKIKISENQILEFLNQTHLILPIETVLAKENTEEEEEKEN